MTGTEAFEATFALVESEERFRAVCETSPVVIWVSDPPEIVYANQAMVDLTGYSREELYRPGFFSKVVHPDDREMVMARGRARVAGEDLPVRYEFRIVTRQGEVRWLDLSASTVNYGGRRHGVYVALDVTGRRIMDATIANLAAIVEASPEAIIARDPEGKITIWNRGAEAMYGWSAAEMLGTSGETLFPPGGQWAFFGANAGDANQTSELQGLTRDGRRLDVEMTIFPLSAGGGSPTGSAAIVRDVTQRKRMERELKASEEHYRSTFENIHDVYYQTDRRGVITRVSPSCERQTGYTRAELEGRQASMVWVNPDDYARFVVALQTMGSVNDFEAPLRRKDGSELWASVNGAFVRGASGEIVGTQGTLRDISERKRAESALHESEERHRQILETTNEGVCLLDAGQRITYVNPAFLHMLGRDRTEVVGGAANAVLAGGLRDDLLERWRKGEAFNDEVRLVHSSGRIIQALASVAPYRNESGEITGMLVMMNDITERKNAERERDMIFTSSIDMIAVMTSAGRFRRVNPAWQRTLGYAEEELLGQSVWHFVHPEDRADGIERGRLASSGFDVHDVRARVRHADGSYRWTSWNIGRVAENGLSYTVVRDITEQIADETQREEMLEAVRAQTVCLAEQAEELDRLRIEAEFSARHDGLTGCLNRKAWFEWAADGRPTAIALYDIDFFKRINDTLGHPVGDEVLFEVARRLAITFDGEATLGRLGGEEFGVLFETPWAEALELASEAVETMSATPIRLKDGRELNIAVSAGLAAWARGKHSREESIALTYEAADRALYDAKEKGRRRLSIASQPRRAA